MEWIYPLIIAFAIVFISELGDKTQILVLSFASKSKVVFVLTGVALGSLLSHGAAIMFGGLLGNINNQFIQGILKIITYLSFILFGIITLKKKETKNYNHKSINKSGYGMQVILIIALSIAVGELGDKTFLASIGLGIQYATYKIALIIGAILGMIASDAIAIFLGKIISEKLSENAMKKLSGVLFLIFGLIGFFNFIHYL